MGFWILLLVNVALFIIGDLIRPKPELEDARPKGLGDFDFPTATEGRVVPIIWGKVMMKGPNVVWYGGLVTNAVSVKVKTGMFSSKRQVTGYNYFIGMQFGLCRGPDVKLHRVEVKEKLVIDVGAGGGGSGGYPINKPNLFGGPDHGGGIMDGAAKFYSGALSQTPNTYLTSKTGKSIAYNGISYFTFEGGYIGDSENIPPWIFELSRRPDGLGLAAYSPGSEAVNTHDCNPMNVIYEIMTDTIWGLGILPTQIDVSNFREVGVVLAAEGNGFSMILDNERKASDVITEIMRQVDGVMYFERTSGKWKVSLARDDYVLANLTILNEDNIVELTDFTRVTWAETTNQVRVKFISRSDEYKDTYAMAQDMANMQLQVGVTSVEMDFPGVKDGPLANRIAWRELAVLSYPIAKVNLKVNRQAFALLPGDTFKLSWARLGVVEVVFRVATIDYGTLSEGVISIYAVQDIFSASTGVFADPPGTGWVVPSTDAVAQTESNMLIFEAPGQLVAQDTYSPTLNPRIWIGARNPGGGTVGFTLFTKTGPSRPLSGDFVEDSDVYAFLLGSTLETLLTEYGATAARPASGVIRVNEADPDILSEIAAVGNESSVSSLVNIIKIDDEFIGFESMVYTSGVYQLSNIYRGLLDSAPAKHASDAMVWFVGQTGGNLTENVIPTGHDELDLQLRSVDRFGTMAEADSNTVSLDTLTGVWSQPLPPRDPKLNGSYAPATATFETDYSTETGFSGENGKGMSVEVTPRCWRINDILTDTVLSSSPVPYGDDNPEFDFSVILDPLGTPLETEVFNVAYTSGNPKAYITRNALIVAAGANNQISSSGRLRVRAKHTRDGYSLETAAKSMFFDFSITTSLGLADSVTFGGITKDVATPLVMLTDSGGFAYTFDIITALPSSGIVEYSIESTGVWNTLIGAGATTGSYTPTGDTQIKLRFNQYPTYDRYFTVKFLTLQVGYGVLKGA